MLGWASSSLISNIRCKKFYKSCPKNLKVFRYRAVRSPLNDCGFKLSTASLVPFIRYEYFSLLKPPRRKNYSMHSYNTQTAAIIPVPLNQTDTLSVCITVAKCSRFLSFPSCARNGRSVICMHVSNDRRDKVVPSQMNTKNEVLFSECVREYQTSDLFQLEVHSQNIVC